MAISHVNTKYDGKLVELTRCAETYLIISRQHARFATGTTTNYKKNSDNFQVKERERETKNKSCNQK